MHSSATTRRLLGAMQATLMVAVLLLPLGASAADEDTILYLRPHCEADDQNVENIFGGPIGGDIPGITTPTTGSQCPVFEVRDPLHLQTDVLKKDDELDMDLLVVNPQGKQITRVRGWIAYDPTLLEGESITLHSLFAAPAPDETDFDTENGLIKIGASLLTPTSDRVVRVARIKLKVLAVSTPETVLSFDDVTGKIDRHAAIITGSGNAEANILPSTLGSFIVRLDAPASSSSTASSASSRIGDDGVSAATSSASSISSVSSASSASSKSSVQTVFTLLQIQNLRATTEGTAVYLAWDPLISSELRGYNVYYGTTKGQYIQRRTVDATSTTLTIRGLMAGTTYYFAVRGMNDKNQETQFSHEVRITVGDPGSSTAPLSASALNAGPGGKGPKTGGNIAGQSGPSSILLGFAIICACIGTMLAFRRQMIASSPASHV